MTSYMNPSKKVTELLSKFLEFDPEQMQMGVWSGDLTLTNVNLRADALYSKINRMKKSPSGRDPLKLKIVEGTISQLRIQIPWKRLVWGHGDVIIDIKGVNIVLGFESREETEARQAAEELLLGKNAEKKNDEKDPNAPVQYSKTFRDAKQKVLAEAEQRLMRGHHLSSWLANAAKNELSVDKNAEEVKEHKAKGFEKWLQKAGSNLVWRFLSGLQINIEGFKLVVLQDNIEVGVIMPMTNVHAGKGKNKKQVNGDLDQELALEQRQQQSPNPDDVKLGDTIDKSIDTTGVSLFIRRQIIQYYDNPQPHQTVLQPNDYVLRPIDLSFSISFFYPHEDQNRKRKAQQHTTNAADDQSLSESRASSKRRRGKRDKHPRGKNNGLSMDGTEETDIVSSFAPEHLSAIGRPQRMISHHSADSLDIDRSTVGSKRTSRWAQGLNAKHTPNMNSSRLSSATHRRLGSAATIRSAPLVRPDDLGSVYATAIAVSTQTTPKFDLHMNCGEVRLLCSSQHLIIVNDFFAVGARMRNGRPTMTVAEAMAKGDKGANKRNTFASTVSGGSSVIDDPLPFTFQRTKTSESGATPNRVFPARRMSMGIRNEVAAKVRSRRTHVLRSWWHYAYGVVAYDIQKRKRRRDNFREKYVSFDWERQKQKRKEYVNLYLSLQLDVDKHVITDNEIDDPEIEALLRIEDELPVEQILLYRSIARALVSHGFRYMPASLDVLYQDHVTDMLADHRRRASITDTSMKIGKRLSLQEYAIGDGEDDDDEENLLTMIRSRCMDGRKYRTYLSQDNVQLFEDPHVSSKNKVAAASADDERRFKRDTRATSMGLGTDSGMSNGLPGSRMDELGASKVSFAYDYAEDIHETPSKPEASKSLVRRKPDNSDGRTVRTFKTTKSAKTSRSSAIAGTVVENMTIDEAEPKGAKLSFSVFFKSVELMLVGDDRRSMTMKQIASSVSRDDSGSGSSDDVSDLSFLSEEEFFREQEMAPIADLEREAEENPILSSTDFLLFGVPENMLLHLTLSPVRCSILGRTGASKNVNFTVGSITATGEGRDNLLAIGSRASPTPVPVVSLSRSRGSAHEGMLRYGSSVHAGPKEAITFSLIVNKGHNVVQADVSKVHVCLDVPLLLKLVQFPVTSDEGNPKRMLPKSEREEARLFILRENSPSKLAGLNSSIRVHGIDLSFPVETIGAESVIESLDSSHSGSVPEKNSPSARLSAQIIELYSGSAVNDLCDPEAEQVGSLGMLDVAELVSSRETFASHHSVVAISGISCSLQTETDAFAFSNAPSLLADPIDVEMLLTSNGSTILDDGSPRQEIVVEISPVHVLISETRLLFCSKVLRPLKAKKEASPPKQDDITPMPPRLEALSRLVMKCLDVSLRSLKVSIMSDEQRHPLTSGQKEIIMKECICDFLSVVSCFDLSFPNEDALSAAMQICIDRLGGLGHPADDALDCANSALISFLEDDCHRHIDSQSRPEDGPEKDAAQTEKNGKPLSSADGAIKNAVEQALLRFPPPDDEMDPDRQPLNNLLFLDFPTGVSLSTIQLFYDSYLAVSVPSLAVTNAAGINLLRLSPIETNCERQDDLGSSTNDFETEAVEPGLVFSRFVLDAEHAFGKGGLPLSVLGSDDTSIDTSADRVREKLDDVRIGELDFLFSHRSFDELLKTISKMKGAWRDPDINETSVDGASQKEDDDNVAEPVKSSHFAVLDTVNVMLSSDDLVPFSQLRFEKAYFRKDGKPSDPHAPYVPVFKFVSRTCALFNLTEEGQFYPDAITVQYGEESTSFPFQLEFIKSSPPWQVGSKLNMELRGFRVFLVRQYINELLQYLLCERYGIGKFKHAMKVADEEKEKERLRAGLPKNTTPPLAYKVFVLDSTLILPRVSKSHDMAAIEIARGVICNSRHYQSFSMPSAAKKFESEKSTSAEEEQSDDSMFTRMNFLLHEMRLFTSLGEDVSTHSNKDSPIFRYFYDVDGRAEDNGWVYCKLTELGDSPPEELVSSFQSLRNRKWKEITTDYLSLDVLVDYAPNLRVLICEPLEMEHFRVAPRLDVRMSQFCMLLSIWYANMQDLPVMFPYTTTQFINSGRNLLWGTIPAEYGTDDYLAVWDDWSCVKTEICVMLRNLAMRCTFDPTGYFDQEPEIKPFFDNPENGSESSVQIYFTDVVVHTYSDLRGMMRVACSAAGFELIDERRSKHCQKTFSIVGDSTKSGKDFSTFADLRWGLGSHVRDIDQRLPQPFQLSVFMTKDWCLINLGIDKADGILIELSPIWFFLGFFVSYYQDGAYGNPGFVSNAKVREYKDVLGSARSLNLQDPDGYNMDFRLWLSKPHLCVPCDLLDPRAPCLRFESETGLWYRYKSMREFKSQEVVSTGLDLLFANEFLAPRQAFDNRDTMVRHLVERLSFGLRLDSNNDCNHSDYALQIPFDVNGSADCSVKSHEISVTPVILDAPTICSPVETPTRFLGTSVCEITCIVEVLPLTSSVLINFFKGPVDENQVNEEIEEEKSTLSFSGNISDLRLFAVDPVLGVQLPVAVVSVSSIILTASQLSNESTNKSQISRGESPPEDLQVTVDSHFWGDYFKLGVTRSWEPLLEPYKCTLLYEKSKYRGTGMSLNADCPLHVNVTGALLLIIDDVIDSFTRLVKEAFGEDTEQELDRVIPKSSLLRERMTVADKVRLRGDQYLAVVHDIPRPLLGDRVAFSFRNLTGQKLRIHQQEGHARGHERRKPAIVTYLNHDEATSLSFDATISVVKNMSVVEVPYPGLPNSQSMTRAKRSTKHAVDVQVPGFRWVQGIKVDTFGRKFESLRPRSSDLYSKVMRDWRLENALQLLVEVGLDNGGRLVTVRSLFELRNNTTHPLSLLLHPDPQYNPERGQKNSQNGNSAALAASDEISAVQPGEFFQIPTVLFESSLHMGGSHLGSLWLKPNSHEDIAIPSLVPGIGHEGCGETNFETNFCSRPIQLAKIVHESAMIFEENADSDIAPEKLKSGVQLSCAVKSENDESLAPFCYAIEIGRSPIVPTKRKATAGSGRFEYPETHGPVAYTLSVHAPFVITNLLPETGRFELMHAVRRTVLWYGDLKPGQQVPVHSVGLDAPLLLLLNLGFCRTPVGEGALVHHGADTVAGAKDNAGLKSLVGKSAGAVGKVVTKGTKVATKGTRVVGKAVTKGTKQIGKTLVAIADSPDKRPVDVGSSDPQNEILVIDADPEQVEEAMVMGFDTGDIGGLDYAEGAKIHSVEGSMYSPDDVAAETDVVDSIGQRLTLNIENIRGGGGQRRVAIYCPFWIVNTTQHSLRYKQENSKSYVSGTVLDSERDGSKPVDGSTRNYVNRHQLARATRMTPNRHVRSYRPMNEGTIFAGTPGALATSPGLCDLSPADLTELIDKDLSLEKLANLAFMFNFHEDVLSIGNRRLSIQLSDATEHVQYFSDWSRGFSLDSVGFSQIVALHCREGRALELSVVVSVAPGFLSGYTKIVRLVPRYALVNQLEYPVRLWQDSSVFRPLTEDRSTTRIDELVRGTQGKWRFATEEDRQLSVINQYEALWGRVTLIDEPDAARILEGTTAHRNSSYITTASPLAFVPFHLPDSRGERQLRVGLGGAWNLTASFASDFPGDHTLRVTRAVDLRFVRHVSTRASPQYRIVLPPASASEDWDGELGIWFETDWGGDRRIIVKGMKRGRYCFNETDIHAGDELLRIDNVSVSGMSFAETMKLLKQRVTQVSAVSQSLKTGESRRSSFFMRRSIEFDQEDAESNQDRLVLTFRTLEERLRRLRMKAAKKSGMNPTGRTGGPSAGGGLGGMDTAFQQGDHEASRPLGGLRVEMKPLHHSMFVVLRRQDPENPPFRIENRSMNYTIFYRQRGCEGHTWNHLKPGSSQAYSWEEPMRPKRLAVRAARDSLLRERAESEIADDYSERSLTSSGTSREIEHKAARAAKLRQILAYQYVEDEEQGRFGTMTIVKLEEIGYRGLLACPSKREDGESRKRGYLNVEVETDGSTRILVVSDDTHQVDEVSVMTRRLETLKQQIREEESRVANLAALRYLLINPSGNPDDADVLDTAARSNLQLYSNQILGFDAVERSKCIESLAKNITDDFPEETTIHRKHQVVVEVLEAVGLNPDNEIGSCNPYCEVVLKGRSKLRKSLFEKRKDKGKTYYQKKSLSPKWTDQFFVFDVPPEAVSVTRGHSIHVRLRNFRFVGAHKLLGQAIVHLHSVRNQEELVGWYPLAGRTGTTELDNPLSHWGRGSVKLRIHWVHSTPALLDYFLFYTERKLQQLQERRHGLKDQWKHVTDAEKRKKERDPLNSKVSQSVLKKQKDKTSSRRLVSSTKDAEYKDIAVSMDPNKLARDRSRLVSYFQKLKKKSRDQDDMQFESEQWTKTQSLPQIAEDSDSSCASSSHQVSGSSDTSLFDESQNEESSAGASNSPRDKAHRGSIRSLQRTTYRTNVHRVSSNKERGRPRRPPLASAAGSFFDKAFARNTGKVFAQKLFKKLSAKRLNTEPDKDLNDSSSMEGGDEFKGLSASRFSNAETIKELLEQGLILHEVGKYFHSIDPYVFYGKADDGTALQIPRMKNWNPAQAIFNDETLDVVLAEGGFKVVVNEKKTASRVNIDSGGSFSKRIAREKLQLPPVAPPLMSQRALQHVEYLVQSRNQFERACRRALRSVLNPGGWLTIRPITALNLPDSYTGMHVKLRYGPEVVVSSTVDAKVTPTWTPKEVMNRMNALPDMYEEGAFWSEEMQAGDVPPALNIDRFEFYVNDLLFYVEPQKTSGSIRLSVVGERLNNKTELGVLHIPLGAAIGSCIDCIEDYLDSFSDTSPSATPMYVRWFPLMNPKDTDPVEGDMGLSSRPTESEKLGDDMFQQYFAPCIQLALMWWPDDRNVDLDAEEEHESENQPDGSVSFHQTQAAPQNELTLTNNYFNADIGRISAALIDSDRAKELLSFSALDIDLRYSVTEAKTRLGLVVGWVQLDHQEEKSREPVVLAPKPVEHIQPTCQLLVVKDNLRSKKNIVSYEHIRLTLEEMDLTIEESWLFDLWDFFIGVIRRREVRKKANRSFESDAKPDVLLPTESRFIDITGAADPETPSLFSLLMGENAEEDAEKRVYVEQLVLGLLKVNLSYVKGKRQTWELTDKGDWVSKLADPTFQQTPQSSDDPSELFTRWSQHTYDEDLWAESSSGKRSQNLKSIIGVVLPNVSDAPIRLQGKVLDNVFESPSEILSSISKFYVMETLRQIYKIIGSLDFVGNPTMLFSSFVSGVRDLVVTPSVAFLRSPTNPSLVGTAVAKGTLSLFSHSTSGIFGFIAKTTAAAGQATAMLSLDPEYREWHRERVVTEATNLNREWKKRGVESVSAMVTKPLGDVALGVLFGVSGLVTAPYRGFRDRGNLGLIQGVAIGGIGLITKPIVGLLDAFAHFTASVHDIAKSVNILERRYQPVLKLRLPYIFGLSNVLMSFDSISTRSVYLLKTFTPKSGKIKSRSSTVARKEIHIASEVLHMEPGVDTYSIVTTLRVVLVKVKKDSAGRLIPTMCWEVNLANDDKVSSLVQDHGHNGVALTVTRRYKPRTGGRFKASDIRKKGNSTITSRDRSQMEKSFDIDDDIDGTPSGEDSESTPQEAAPPSASSKQLKVQWEANEKESGYHSHGATRGNAGETLEWFTVLAEYPNRPQLTRIHNAISCLLGNLKAVVRDQRLSPGLNTEGSTTFGLFDFEADSSDATKDSHLERHLVAALERLPWMHDSSFEATRGKTHEEQRAHIHKIRNEWVFSRELEASIQIGGPAWLIEARAHAMFLPSEAPSPPRPLSRNDPVIKQIMYQQEQGNISCAQVRTLFASHMQDINCSPDSAEDKNIWRKRASELADNVLVAQDEFDLDRFDEFPSALSNISTTLVHPGSDRPNLADFETNNLDVFLASYDEMPTTLVRPRSVQSEDSDKDDSDDFLSLGTTRTGSSNELAGMAHDKPKSKDSISQPDADDVLSSQGTQIALGGDNARVSARRVLQFGEVDDNQALPQASMPAQSEDRINRMEGLMEQLVIFNSQLALMKGPSLAETPTASIGGQGHSALQEEIHALRGQLEQQALKEEATNELLSDLRQELTTIRAQLTKDEDDNGSEPIIQVKRTKGRKSKKDKEKKKKQGEGEEEGQGNEGSAREKPKRKGSNRRWFRGSFRGSAHRGRRHKHEKDSVNSSLPPLAQDQEEKEEKAEATAASREEEMLAVDSQGKMEGNDEVGHNP